ncbi:MAG: protein kinase, partial [Acidobacteriota bacterium]|nr:protein kinase [Acidobacteriota bacterium]
MKLGRYEIVRELGKGAMGIVYLAKDPLIGRLVALKTIRPTAHADDDEDTREFQQRFVREAQAAGILNHPSIVTVHDIGQDEPTGMSFIAMEYVEGKNLKEVLSQGPPLSFEQAADIIAQVAEGLDFAHAKGIVHRDVKPANVILLDGNRAKITDFGIAKITSGVNLTTTGQFLGTPNYMAPEQIKGTPVDGRSDIFSLGICLYECLTHRKPFGGDSLTSISYKIVHEPFPPLHEVNPTIPEGFADVVTHCLAKDPAKRYQRGKDVAVALRAVIRGERPMRSSDPLLADATVITRDHDKLPTMEIPFPEADTAEVADEVRQPLDTNPAVAMPMAPAPAAARPVRKTKAAGVPVWKQPIWKQRIDPIVFVSVAGVLLAVLGIVMLVLRARQVAVPVVDTRAEARVAKERRLRTEGGRFLHEGRVNDAFDRYEQVLKLAPRSPAISALMQKLSQVRQQDEIGRQQLATAQQKFDQGLALYNQKKFAEAIPLLEESFHLNPSSDATAQYLKAAQQEDARVKAERVTTRAAKATTQRVPQTVVTPASATTRPAGTTTTRAPQPVAPQTASAPASLTTVINSTVTDGYIVVRAGADEVARENLWVERRFFHTRAPRQVNVTKEFPAKNADLDFWVSVPSLGVNEHRTLRAQNFEPGVNHRLVITLDP